MQSSSSQTPRSPMFTFEFVGELFQIDAREPQFAPLFQLPPKSAANLPMLPPAFLPRNPAAKQPSHLGKQHLMDMFEFQSGAHQASKARAIPYLAADVFTLGLAELILWPIEMTAFEAATCHGMATYNAQQKVIAWQATTKAGQSSVQDC